MCLLVALDVEEGVPVPKLGLALAAERDARRLTVPNQQTSGQIVQFRTAILSIPAGNTGKSGSTLNFRAVLKFNVGLERIQDSRHCGLKTYISEVLQ